MVFRIICPAIAFVCCAVYNNIDTLDVGANGIWNTYLAPKRQVNGHFRQAGRRQNKGREETQRWQYIRS